MNATNGASRPRMFVVELEGDYVTDANIGELRGVLMREVALWAHTAKAKAQVHGPFVWQLAYNSEPGSDRVTGMLLLRH